MDDEERKKQAQFIVRLPEGLRDRLKKVAEANKRSMNAEVIQALEFHIEGEEYQEHLRNAREQWLEDPDYKPDDFPELTDSQLPATKGDVDRLLLAIRQMVEKM